VTDKATPYTIVLREGIYREGELVIDHNNLTIQRDGTQPVSLYGSVPLTGFSDHAPFTKTISSMQDPDSSHPRLPDQLADLCADPELPGSGPHDPGAETPLAVTRAGIPLRRVALDAMLQPGQYKYDPASHQLTVSDSPDQIELAYRRWAIMTNASNVKLAGLDVENYATCAVGWTKNVSGRDYYKAAIIFYKDQDSDPDSNSTLESSTVANNAAGAVAAIRARGVHLTGNMLVNNGFTAAHAHQANGLVVTGNQISFNNVRRWSNFVDAGMKLTHVEDGVVLGNVFEHNAATGFWCDEHCGATHPDNRWFVIARNLVRFNDKTGIFYEISHHAVIASNVVHDNGASGIAAFGSRNLRIWNNTAVDNTTDSAMSADRHADISVIDDPRCFAGDTLPGGMTCEQRPGLEPLSDTCEANTGPLANTCNAEGVSIVNNILSGSGSARPLLNVEDVSAALYGAARIASTEDYQAYWRPNPTTPATLIDWQIAPGSAATSYSRLVSGAGILGMRDAVEAAYPDADYEAHSVERMGGATHPFFVDYAGKNFGQSPVSPDISGRGAALPSEVLKAVYWPETSPAQPIRRIGAIEWAGKPVIACPLTVPVYHRGNPTTGDHLLTTSADEAAVLGAAPSPVGYPSDHGVAFAASPVAQAGVVPVFRLYNPTRKLHFWTTSASERDAAAASLGYTTDQGVGFYAAPTATACTTGVYRLQSAGNHVYTVSTAERDLLVAAGWVDEGVRFYTAP
jgi:parallel beta-helix repeat protein